MKTSRSVGLVDAAASLLATGWALGTGFLNPTGAAGSSAAVTLSEGTHATPSASASGATGTFDGAAVRTRYGNFQVEAVIRSGTITDVKMLQSGSNDGTSRQITDYALPLLIHAVLQQQTWNVGYASGANYSTQGFEASLKDALAQAGLV